jgi:hypothetical protein
MGCPPVGRERQDAGHTARSCFVWPRHCARSCGRHCGRVLRSSRSPGYQSDRRSQDGTYAGGASRATVEADRDGAWRVQPDDYPHRKSKRRKREPSHVDQLDRRASRAFAEHIESQGAPGTHDAGRDIRFIELATALQARSKQGAPHGSAAIPRAKSLRSNAEQVVTVNSPAVKDGVTKRWTTRDSG